MRAALAAAAVLLLAAVILAAAAPQATAASVRAYRGLGGWIDLYDAAAWADPAAAVADLAGHGVRTLYLETSNSSWPVDLEQPAALDAFITESHARGLKVVAWYLPTFVDPARDYRRSMAAIGFRTPGGQRFDSFALDIESSAVKPASTRTLRVRRLSARIRSAVGDTYPLGGIIPSPVGMTLNATYWPGFPYDAVAQYYDVVMPMGYYTYHGDGYRHAYDETRENVRLIRVQTGRPAIPIHVIAGLAAKSDASETLGYVRALRENGCLGGSIYDWATSGDEDWRALANVRFNPAQRPSLPRDLGYVKPLGNLPGERTHPQEVFFVAGPQSGDRILRFRVYDLQVGEVRLIVNWRDAGTLKPGPTGYWSGVHHVVIPASLLKAGGRNVIGFVARGMYPVWSVWGVRDVSLKRS